MPASAYDLLNVRVTTMFLRRVRVHAEDAAGSLAEGSADRVGVLAQAFAGQGGAERVEDARGRRIGVLVGVELDEDLALRLLAGRVAGHAADVGSEEVEHEDT